MRLTRPTESSPCFIAVNVLASVLTYGDMKVSRIAARVNALLIHSHLSLTPLAAADAANWVLVRVQGTRNCLRLKKCRKVDNVAL